MLPAGMPSPRAFSIAAALLAACPAPAPSSDATRREPPAPRAVEPVPEPAVVPQPAAVPQPSAVPQPIPTVPEPAPDTAIPLPPALAAEGVRPVVRSLWRALEAVDAGDAGAMARVTTNDARWFPPGGLAESVQGATHLQRAMAPWSNPEVDLDVRRVIDPGVGSFAAQVSATSRESPALRHELVLLVEARGDHVAAVHHFGDPLGPVRLGLDEQEPLDLGPVDEPALEHGAAAQAQVDAARTVATALDDRNDDAVRALLTEDVVLHDVKARRTRRGPDGYVAGMRETLGETGHLAVNRHLAGPRFVVLEGAVLGHGPPMGKAASEPASEPQEHGFVDVHRMVDGKIAETWHYVNRRGRPHRLRP
jgi:ketosteroid isomerase-like protein